MVAEPLEVGVKERRSGREDGLQVCKKLPVCAAKSLEVYSMKRKQHRVPGLGDTRLS